MEIGVSEARQRFPELVLRAAYGKEDFTILRRGTPVARLMPIDQSKKTETEATRDKQKRNRSK